MRFAVADPQRVWIGDAVTGKAWLANWRTGELPAFETTNDPSFVQIDIDRAGKRLLLGRHNAAELRAAWRTF